MARKQATEVKLGGETYAIETPTLDQLWAITDLQQKAIDASTPQQKMMVSIDILCVLIGKKREEVRATMVELLDALPVVMRVTGFDKMVERARAIEKKPKAPAQA